MAEFYSQKTAGVADHSGRPHARPAIVCRRRAGSPYITLPPLAVHSVASAASAQPWPLQEFMPWPGEALPPLQALWPLQALAPAHFTLAALAAVAKVPAAKRAAAVAMMVRLVMICAP